MESVDETGLGSHGFSNENVPFPVVYLFTEVFDRKRKEEENRKGKGRKKVCTYWKQVARARRRAV